MSNWNNGGGWGGGKRAPKPRPTHGPEHELEPRIEAILRKDRNVPKNYHSPGESPSRETLLLEGDPERSSIEVPKVAMIFKQAGYPLNHDQYPPIKKFNSEYPDSNYYFVHTGPVFWKNDENFRHIPTYSRYVIDRFGRVLNAVTGVTVQPENERMYKLVSDGPAFSNNPFWVAKDVLLMLAFSTLPENFIDYGGGTYSHELKVDADKGEYTWVARPQVKVRNSETGQTKLYPNFPEFIECAVKDFQQAGELRRHLRKPIEGVLSVGPFQIKLAEEVAMPELPKAGDSSTAAPVKEEAPVASTETQVEDVDIDFGDIEF